jgi:hypothetical protein
MLQKEKDAAIGGFYILGVLICGYGGILSYWRYTRE